jgi:hypothetical protein
MIRRADEAPRVEVQTEEERPGGWLYAVVVHRGGATDEYAVTLSWRDHDYWCGGALAPSRVMQAVMEYLVQHMAELPQKFDAARARRILARIDQELKALL